MGVIPGPSRSASSILADRLGVVRACLTSPPQNRSRTVAVLLHRLGRWAFRRRKTVLLAWVIALLAFGGLAGAFGRDADAQLTILGVESVNALETLQERFPGGAAGGATARVVFAAPEGAAVTDPAVREGVERALAEAA